MLSVGLQQNNKQMSIIVCHCKVVKRTNPTRWIPTKQRTKRSETNKQMSIAHMETAGVNYEKKKNNPEDCKG